MSILFNCQKHFYFKQFSLVSQTILIQTILFCISLVFLHAQLIVKTILIQTIQFSVSMEFKCQNSSISSNSVQHKYAVQFCLTQRWNPIRRYHTRPEWTLEQWQLRGTPHSPKVKHQIVLRQFRTLIVGGLTLLQRSSRCILQPQPPGQYIYIYIYIYRERERDSYIYIYI